jgi:hypothetical protein
MNMRLYVWEPEGSWPQGIFFALAGTVEKAREQIKAKAGVEILAVQTRTPRIISDPEGFCFVVDK